MSVPKTPKPKQRKRVAKPPAAKAGQARAPAPAVTPPRFVVGIGSSAGGLEALRALFSALEHSSSMTYIVVQHLAPQHRSRLVEILSHSTDLHVKEVEDGDQPAAQTIYITPPNADVTLDGGRLRLSRPQMKIGPKPCIDHFFRSLADNYREAAIGIILSGTGSDGALGMRAIKAAGGFTLAQSVASAKYDGMPKAARQTGAVDMELDPEGIAAELARFNGMDKLQRDHGNELDNDPFDEILALLYRHNGACFSQYKMSTVRRRVDRRLVATRCQSLEEYLQYLYDHPEEAGNLFQDILISVTAFFRDAESFFKLNEHIEARVRDKPMHGHFRCWVVGCATGEEAYSLAILIQEAIEKFGKRLRLQFFATDLDPLALNIARKGCYPESSFSAFPSFLREKYFQPQQGQFQIKPSLRESIVFARHDITRDAPFLNTDLVSCRNVLIYFNQRLQESVFQTMHYSLLDKALLFLGRSETVPASAAKLFDSVDKQARIYVCQGGQSNHGRSPLSSLNSFPSRALAPAMPAQDESVSPHFLIQSLAPDSVILDNEEKVKHVFGRANEILKFPQGETTTAIRRLLPSPLALELVALIQRTRKTNSPVTGRRHPLPQPDAEEEVRMRLVPLQPRGPGEMLLTFEILRAEARPNWRTPEELAELPPDERVVKLEEEMLGLREHLQAVIEEHETANEELQALNEELQSANEELQSSNEELETTNEELQSTNEELTTLNQELNVKSSELTLLYQRHQAVQNAIVYPLLIVDRHQHVLNFNPAARHLLRLGDGDIGTHLRALSTPIDLDEVLDALTPALERQADTSVAFNARDRSFEVQIQLFRGHREQAEGAVISFVDNTEISSVLNETRVIKGRLASIIDHTPSLVTMKDLSGVYMFANRIFCELTGTEHADVIGATDDELFGEEAAREIRERDYEVLKQNRALQFEESFLLNGEMRFWTSAKFPLLDTNRRPYSVCTISLDISDRVLRQRQLELFKQAIASANSGTVILEDGGEGLRSTFCSVQMSARFGLEPEGLLDLSLEAFFARLHVRETPGSLQRLLAAVVRQPATTQTLHVQSPTQGELTFEVRSTLMPPREGAGTCLILSFFDISQRMLDQRTILAQQEELIRYGRFSALGEIAAGISHEINTPLNVITTKTDILRKASQLGRLDSARTQSLAQDIDEVVKGISSIVHGLKSAVGIDAGSYERAEVQRLVRDAVKICEFRLQRQGVELRLDLPEKPIMIACYPVQIMQIIINLLNNAIEAIGALPERWIHIVAREQDGKALVRVQDSGPGIDLNLAEKIMTPFFTTKQDTNGSGIGLSLSRSIARRHQGDLVIDASQDYTTFQLELGLASAEEEA